MSGDAALAVVLALEMLVVAWLVPARLETAHNRRATVAAIVGRFVSIPCETRAPGRCSILLPRGTAAPNECAGSKPLAAAG